MEAVRKTPQPVERGGDSGRYRHDVRPFCPGSAPIERNGGRPSCGARVDTASRIYTGSWGPGRCGLGISNNPTERLCVSFGGGCVGAEGVRPPGPNRGRMSGTRGGICPDLAPARSSAQWSSGFRSSIRSQAPAIKAFANWIGIYSGLRFPPRQDSRRRHSHWINFAKGDSASSR